MQEAVWMNKAIDGFESTYKELKFAGGSAGACQSQSVLSLPIRN